MTVVVMNLAEVTPIGKLDLLLCSRVTLGHLPNLSSALFSFPFCEMRTSLPHMGAVRNYRFFFLIKMPNYRAFHTVNSATIGYFSSFSGGKKVGYY